MSQKNLLMNIVTDCIFQSLSPTEQSRLLELLESSQELRQVLNQYLQSLTKEDISQKELDGSMSSVLTVLPKPSSTNLESTLPALSRLILYLVNQNLESNFKPTYRTTLTTVFRPQSIYQTQKTPKKGMFKGLLESLRNTPQDSEDLPAILTVVEEGSQLRLSTMKKLLSIKEWSTKKTIRVERESAESDEDIRSWVRNNIS